MKALILGEVGSPREVRIGLRQHEVMALISKLAESLTDVEYKKRVGHQWLSPLSTTGRVVCEGTQGTVDQSCIIGFEIDITE